MKKLFKNILATGLIGATIGMVVHLSPGPMWHEVLVGASISILSGFVSVWLGGCNSCSTEKCEKEDDCKCK